MKTIDTNPEHGIALVQDMHDRITSTGDRPPKRGWTRWHP